MKINMEAMKATCFKISKFKIYVEFYKLGILCGKVPLFPVTRSTFMNLLPFNGNHVHLLPFNGIQVHLLEIDIYI